MKIDDNKQFSFENLEVYQTARVLVKEIYLLQNKFPKEEKYALETKFVAVPHLSQVTLQKVLEEILLKKKSTSLKSLLAL